MTTTDQPRALCATLIRTEGDLWFSPEHADREKAKEHCARCPLQSPCAAAALADPTSRGVWGGTDTRERGRARGLPDGPDPDDEPADRQLRPRRPCGGEDAFKAHRVRKEVCAVCEAAHAARTLAGRLAALEVAHGMGGTARGAAVHRRLGEAVCERCARAAAGEQAARKAERKARRARDGLRGVPGASGARGRTRGAQEPVGAAA